MSLADDIFGKIDKDGLRRKPFKAWGKEVWIWELTAGQSDEFEAGRFKQVGKKSIFDARGSRAKLVVLCLRNSGAEDAEAIFTEDHIRRLQKAGRKELDRIYEECAIFNGIAAGLDDEDEETDAAKNSAAPAAGSSSV